MITNEEGTGSPVSDFCLQRSALECSLLDKGKKNKVQWLILQVRTYMKYILKCGKIVLGHERKRNQEYLRILYYAR